MFWKKKAIKKKNKRTNLERRIILFSSEFPISKRVVKHERTILDGKLYDTEKSEFISSTKDQRDLFVTKKGNYFSCKVSCSDYRDLQENEVCDIHEITYYDIRPEPLEYAMSNIGKYEPEKYIELFGEVEEA